MTAPNQTAYLAPLGYENLLIDELREVKEVYGRLVVTRGGPQKAHWAQNIWYRPIMMPIRSIRHAAVSLKALQRNWWPYAFRHFRRMKLIEEQLPHVSAKPLAFLESPPTCSLGSYTLIDENTLLFSENCLSPRPHGEWNFHEDKTNPPNRAYLKLWELFTRLQIHPNKNQVCLDLGASPGGWTWVLAMLAKQVIAYDRSPLNPGLMALKNVTYKSQDAFKVKLSDYPKASWVFSDIVCYPEKLYNFIENLLHNFPDKKYVFTIKFQGTNHRDIISRFDGLPGQLLHLTHNKHELTWYKI